MSETFIQKDLRDLFEKTLSAAKNICFKYIKNSIYLEKGSATGTLTKEELAIFDNFANKWEESMALPLFEKFTHAFKCRLANMLEDADFRELLKA